jgi:hypothetical protein
MGSLLLFEFIDIICDLFVKNGCIVCVPRSAAADGFHRPYDVERAHNIRFDQVVNDIGGMKTLWNH